MIMVNHFISNFNYDKKGWQDINDGSTSNIEQYIRISEECIESFRSDNNFFND